MLQEETGPWAIFQKLRERVDQMDYKDGGIREGFYCFQCLSIWIALALVTLMIVFPPLCAALVLVVSFSTLGMFLNDAYEKWNR